MGSVFSPYYKASGRTDPIDHASLNVALYGPKSRWAMTERPRSNVAREEAHLQIGPSGMHWTGDSLEIDIVERDKRILNPWRRPVRGKVRVIPEALNPIGFALTAEDRHVWHCLAPRARIEVEMEEPGLSWTGTGYLDHNRGEDPLEDGFNVWHWSRAHLSKGALVCYEGERKDGSRFASAIHFDAQGIPHKDELPPVAPLPSTSWRIRRQTRSDNRVSKVIRSWEDTPFYSRSELRSTLYGEEVTAVQESLDMRRFASPLIQRMLKFRMPREDQ